MCCEIDIEFIIAFNDSVWGLYHERVAGVEETSAYYLLNILH